MATYKAPGRKEYDGKPNRGPFQTIEKCQEFATKVYQYTVKAEKEYRVSICKTVQDYCCEMVHSARKQIVFLYMILCGRRFINQRLSIWSE